MQQYRDNETLEIISNALKKVRNNKNLTLEDVYNDTGLNISRIEGARANITISTIKKLCDYYEITVFKFFSEYCGKDF